MRKFGVILGLFIFLFILLPTNNNYVYAEKLSGEVECFIDLDGDGFNDSVGDIDNNDLNENIAVAQSRQNSESLVSFDFGSASDIAAPLYNCENFKLLKFSARALQSNRGESDAGFGGNSGGVSSSSQSGGCAGGACIAN